MAQYSAIAESVQSMDTINFLRVHAKKLRFLNLHGNNIRTISNLDDCFYLEELDLSSNKIVTISGLEACESLLRLNLSCNQIKVAASLDFLYKLKHLNLSYNKLTQVKTLSQFAEKRFQLEELFLHGNKLNSVPATIGAIRKILTLKRLTLHSNPLCQNSNYRKAFGDCMPQLETIDDFPRTDDSFSESITTDSSISTQPIVTPHIDKAIKNFKHDLSSEESLVTNQESIVESQSEKENDNVRVQFEGNKSDSQDAKIPSDADYTNLIKQVLTAIREEEIPVKLNKESDCKNLEEETRASNLDALKDPEVSAAQINIESLKSTNKLLLAELETERERRWKSEKHIAELSDKMVKNEHAIQEYESLNKSSEAGINGIRNLLMKEQGQKMKLANLLETYREKHKDVVNITREKEEQLKKREEEIQNLHKTIEKMRSSTSDTVKQHQLSLQQSRQEAQVQRKECELLRHQLNDHQVQVKSLQELIVTREQEHVREKGNLVPLHGEEFNKRANEILENERQKHDLMSKNLIDSAKNWQEKHVQLEKEFRIALYLENKKYEQLHSSFTKISGELSSHRNEVKRLKSEDTKKLSIIEKLKRGVVEQSTAIDKLRKSRSDMEEKCKARISALEKELEESTKSVLELTGFQKENITLKNENQALQSVIEGLRAERNLWSRELAEQGSQLALDRGALQNEIKVLRKELSEKVEELHDLTDKSRIKEHQFNDAMDTITKLKQTIVHNQQELNDITKLEQRIAGISQEKEDAETRVEALRQALNSCQEEREEILQKFEDVTEEGDLLKRKYKDLKQQWQEKIDILNTVEKATEEMSLRHLEQEKKWRKNVEEENEKILQLEQQIGAMKENHEVELRQQKVDADKRLQESVSREDSYKDQIAGLEREMRLIIHQSQQLKKENEAKLTKLAGALGEFTTLLQPK